MNEPEQKCVVVIDSSLPLGLIANTAAMLGIPLGKLHPLMVGEDVTDASGKTHAGISMYPISMLKGDEALLKDLRLRLFEPEFAGLTVVDFSDVAQRSTSMPTMRKSLPKRRSASMSTMESHCLATRRRSTA